jgi:hypothetical protein
MITEASSETLGNVWGIAIQTSSIMSPMALVCMMPPWMLPNRHIPWWVQVTTWSSDGVR